MYLVRIYSTEFSTLVYGTLTRCYVRTTRIAKTNTSIILLYDVHIYIYTTDHVYDRVLLYVLLRYWYVSYVYQQYDR